MQRTYVIVETNGANLLQEVETSELKVWVSLSGTVEGPLDRVQKVISALKEVLGGVVIITDSRDIPTKVPEQT